MPFSVWHSRKFGPFPFHVLNADGRWMGRRMYLLLGKLRCRFHATSGYFVEVLIWFNRLEHSEQYRFEISTAMCNCCRFSPNKGDLVECSPIRTMVRTRNWLVCIIAVEVTIRCWSMPHESCLDCTLAKLSMRRWRLESNPSCLSPFDATPKTNQPAAVNGLKYVEQFSAA